VAPSKGHLHAIERTLISVQGLAVFTLFAEHIGYVFDGDESVCVALSESLFPAAEGSLVPFYWFFIITVLETNISYIILQLPVRIEFYIETTGMLRKCHCM
jgi:hypothetical protein